MTTHTSNLFKLSAIALAVSASALPSTSAYAQQPNAEIEKIEVTATRRTGSVQEIPINITALTADTLKEQNIGDLDEVARWVPGLTVTDQGGRSDSPIIVRGLNTNSSGPGSDGGTVATYVGEIPLFVNMRLNDIQRVEVLIGPQGTLYGAGTLGGAIRYIPKPVDLDLTTGEVYGDVFSLKESDSIGGEAGGVFNLPLIEGELGLRVSLNYFNNPGFIDYSYALREGGVSLPDPDWSNDSEVNSNLRSVKDANGEDTTTARIALRWQPTDDIDATLTYFYQKQDVEGRSIVHYNSLADSNPLSDIIGPYESAYRYEEPREKEDDLLSLEITADLGFAELVSATGKSTFKGLGQRDQTDLLIRLAYSYEEFPAFSAFTREIDDIDIFTQELRLVSQGDGDLSWIVGAFYYDLESFGESREFTPNYDEFVIANDWFSYLGDPAYVPRPDDLEYLSVDRTDSTEKAIYGELTYAISDVWNVTLGARYYEYEVNSASAVDLPLFETVGFGRDPDSEVLDFEVLSAEDDGTLFKLNTSYQFSSELMGYFTVSEGFRIGGANGVPLCPDPLPGGQIVCAQPNEVLFAPDTTTNYELGFKSSWNKNKFHFNAALFNVDWDDAQVSGATVQGQQPITTNAEGANAKGVEVSSRIILSDNLTAYATYSYVKAELTADAPFLFEVIDDEDLIAKYGTEIQDYYDGKDGDRLPGSPEHQFAFGLKYTTEVMGGKLLDVVYGLTAQSDVYTKVGLRADGETLGGYALSNFSATLSDDDWAVTFYVDNLFDKYAITSVRRDKGDIGLARFDEKNSNRPDLQRNYGYYLNSPRQVGVKFTYTFDL